MLDGPHVTLGKLAYIRLLLNGVELLQLGIIGKIPVFPAAGTWRRQRSNPLLNPVNSRREICKTKLAPLGSSGRVIVQN